MKKKLHSIIILVVIVSLVASCSKVTYDNINNDTGLKKYNKTGDEIVFDSYDEKIGDNIPIIRGEIAKSIALTFSDTNAIENVEQIINFEDVDTDDIYYKYIQICANMGYMKGDGITFRPYDNISLKEASDILLLINPNNNINLEVNDKNKDKPVSYGLWTELYIDTLNNLSSNDIYSKYKIKKINPIILATNDDNPNLLNYIITDIGKLRCTNLDLSFFRDTQISAYIKDEEVILIESFLEKTPTIENAYIYNYTKDKITIFAGGVYRDYKIINGDDNDLNGSICNIKINNDTAQSVIVYKESITEKVRLIDGEKIVLSNNKSYALDENFKAYGTYANTLTIENNSDIRVGATARFVVKDDNVLSAVFDHETYPDRVRVLLNDSSFSNIVHSTVTVSGTNGLVINEKSYEPNQEVTINNQNYTEYIKDSYLEIKPVDNGKIILKSINRAGGYIPEYRGIIEVSKVDGGFRIISDVTLDEYLYQVVPSEMPSSYGIEASKVQAICARTYVYKQYYKGAYEKYGANVDDSTSCQVYNNIVDNEVSINAVNDTSGQIIMYDNKPIDAFFFSTSGGTTASAGDVWTTDVNNFPSSSVEYLKSSPQYNEENIDLTVEENAYEFFKNTNLDAIEKNVDWFRWNFTLKIDELSTSINNNIATRYKARPDTILTKQSDGTFKSTPVDSVGLVKDLQVIKRGDGGNVIILDIIGSDKTVRVYTEYNVRAIIKPYQYIIGREAIVLNMVNKTMENYSLMPSSFFTMDKTMDSNGQLASVTFYGGGNGHSVGLSQNGANELLKMGMSTEDVIEHYYKGSIVKKIGEF